MRKFERPATRSLPSVHWREMITNTFCSRRFHHSVMLGIQGNLQISYNECGVDRNRVQVIEEVIACLGLALE